MKELRSGRLRVVSAPYERLYSISDGDLKVMPNDKKLRYHVMREQLHDMDNTPDAASEGKSEVIEEVSDEHKGKSS